MSFGEEVRRLAENRGFVTQQQLADASGLSQSFIARLYSGKRKEITFDAVLALSKALGVTCEHFSTYFSPPPAPSPPPPARRARKKPPA